MIQTKRLGQMPAERPWPLQSGAGGSPDVIYIQDPSTLELAGTEAMRTRPVCLVIGTKVEVSHLSDIALPEGAAIAPHETAVFVPEEVLLAAARELEKTKQEAKKSSKVVALAA